MVHVGILNASNLKFVTFNLSGKAIVVMETSEDQERQRRVAEREARRYVYIYFFKTKLTAKIKWLCFCVHCAHVI